ncbi:MAG: glycosyltransferase family 2 protein [Candidatus Eiseniibacteriota bacterium]
MKFALIVPALDEEASVAGVVRGFFTVAAAAPFAARAGAILDEIVVCDNGSRDRTAEVARAAGATVVPAPRRGYGSACLAGLVHLATRAQGLPDAVAFADGDGSDDPSELASIVAPIARGEADLVIGSRTLGAVERGAMSVPQRFGNGLASFLLRTLYGAKVTDLGPYRAVRWSALERMALHDPDYGWTVEMQAKAARLGLPMREVPVTCRARAAGRSKVSGTVRGVIGAGTKILGTIAREALRPRTNV